jgi:uncharacterized protein (UPF0248 family)
MTSADEAKKKAAATYNAAADFYDYPTNTFWERYGRRTIERLQLAPGARVLDVCCGSGASAIPWDRICEVETLRSLLNAAGIEEVEVCAEIGTQPINSPDDWWLMVMGSGYRGTIEQLSIAERERVKEENLSFIREENIRAVETNVLYAVASV